MTHTQDLTVGVWNIERFGYVRGRGHTLLPLQLEWLLQTTPTPPDILALPESTQGLLDGQSAIRSLAVHTLAPHLADGWYEPLFASAPPQTHRNHGFLVLVNTARVKPCGWYDPHATDAGNRHFGFADCVIFGHKVSVCDEHWSGGEGRAVFDQAANRVSNKGNKRKTLLLGDFNADSGWERELHLVNKLNWYKQCRDQDNLDKIVQKGWFNPDGVDPHTGEPGWYIPWKRSGKRGWWEIDTSQIDFLREFCKYVDMGEEAGDPTPTTRPKIGSGLRIDRIFRSLGFPAEVTHYAVAQPPRELSDHAYVYGTYRVEEAEEPWDPAMIAA